MCVFVSIFVYMYLACIPSIASSTIHPAIGMLCPCV